MAHDSSPDNGAEAFFSDLRATALALDNEDATASRLGGGDPLAEANGTLFAQAMQRY